MKRVILTIIVAFILQGCCGIISKKHNCIFSYKRGYNNYVIKHKHGIRIIRRYPYICNSKFSLAEMMTSCNDIDAKRDDIEKDLILHISPYPMSCNPDKAFEVYKEKNNKNLSNDSLSRLDENKFLGKYEINQIKKNIQQKISKTCTPSMTQEHLDYLRKLWVKQYMIDAYPELYPEPKEKYLTPDEMKLVEKMYELE